MAYEYERELMDYLNQIKASLLARPLLLGGIAASGGGAGGPPGGFLGQLPQTRVTFDMTEGEEWGYALTASGMPSGTSLVTNLNRIRYRIAALEDAGPGGGGTVAVSEDGVIIASGVTIINFVGAEVTPIGGGVTVTFSSHTAVTVFDTASVDLTLTGQQIVANVIPAGIKLDDLGTPDDNLDLNASFTRHGLSPKLPGDPLWFYNGIGGWTPPSGSQGHIIQQDFSPLPQQSRLDFIGSYVTLEDDDVNTRTKIMFGVDGFSGEQEVMSNLAIVGTDIVYDVYTVTVIDGWIDNIGFSRTETIGLP